MKTCEKCKGKGSYEIHEGHPASGRMIWVGVQCEVCKGKGRISEPDESWCRACGGTGLTTSQSGVLYSGKED